jgi:non-ribosomal peptide synthetase component F
MRRVPHVQFTNLYGPTEATIASSYYTVEACPDDPGAPLPIGRPCAGEELLVLDEAMRPVPPGETGDLYIGGVGLSPGYWRDPEKTAAAFVAHPDRPGERITGRATWRVSARTAWSISSDAPIRKSRAVAIASSSARSSTRSIASPSSPRAPWWRWAPTGSRAARFAARTSRPPAPRRHRARCGAR